jgi:LuxR family maltose regulon positive regulatory protein
MVGTVALAKIQPPRVRPDQIERAGIERALGEALTSHRVTALIAPAGFGKSVALARVVSQLPATAARAWVSLDEDDDAPRLLACMIGALEPFDLPWRTAPAALLSAVSADDAARRAAVSTLANALAAAEVPRGVMVLDDVHRVRERSALCVVEQLVEWLPPAWSLALAARTEPALPLARWRARGELVEFRSAALRFSADELAALIHTTPDDARVTDLLARTEGWAAGVRLSLGSPADAPNHAVARRHLADYLAAEIFDTLPDDLRRFLLRTSVLPELTARRAATVSGDERAAHWLEEIDRRGLFATPLEGDEPTLRVHDLFREFLAERLERELPEEVPGLLVRAAHDEADPVRRIGWLLRGGAMDAAQRALAESAPAMLAAGADAPLLRLVEQFPAALRERSPVLAFVRGLVALPRFEWVTMQQCMRRAADGFAHAGRDAPARRASVFEVVALATCGRLEEASARLATLRAQPLDRDTEALAELMAYWETGARGPADAPVRHLRRMTDRLASGAPPEIWSGCVPHFMFLGRPGVHAALRRWADLAATVAGDAHVPLRAAANTVTGWVLVWQGRLAQAAGVMQGVESDLRWLGRPRGLQLLALAYESAAATLRADQRAANAAFDALIADVDRDTERRATWRGVYLCLAAQCAASVGDWSRAEYLAALLADTAPDQEWPYMRLARRVLAGRVALHTGDLERTVAETTGALRGLGDVDLMGTCGIARVTLAQALSRQGRESEAWDVLGAAAACAVAEEEPAAFLLAGAEALEELAAVPCGTQPIAASGHAALRRLAETARALRRTAGTAGAAPSRGGLTAREQEVLARIAAGDSNKVIARTIGLSPHTVKRHVANILDKLALATRGQAAAWYREHGSS